MGNDRIDRLITQISRRYTLLHSTNAIDLPSDAASIRVGRELGHLFLMGKDKVQQENVLQLLCRPDIHPSIACAFFQVLEQRIQKDDFIEGSFLTEWMLTLEQQQVIMQSQSTVDTTTTIALSACIRTYAVYLVHSYDVNDEMITNYQNGGGESSQQRILSTWKRFKLASTRWQATREVIVQALQYPTSHFIAIVAPILSTVLFVTTDAPASPENMLEQTRFLSFLQRQIWNIWNTENAMDKELWLRFIIAAFDIYSLVSRNHRRAVLSNNEMAQDWFIDIIELLTMMTSVHDKHTTEPKKHIQNLSRIVLLQRLLPRILQHYSALESIPVLEAAGNLLTTVSSNKNNNNNGSSSSTYDDDDDDALIMVLRLSTQCLVTHDPRERMILLEILQECNTVFHRRLLRSVASILIHDESCRDMALALQRSMTAKNIPPIPETLKMFSALFNLNGTISPSLVELIASTARLDGTQFSPRQQMAALLWGVTLLDDKDRSHRALPFLRSLVMAYSHLSIPLLAIITERLQQVSIEGDGSAVMQYLEFLAETLVLNAHCAQEVWNLFVQWLNAHSPLTLRVALVRLFPKLISGNKRLYRRVVDALGICSGSNEVGIKLAAAATLADLAEQDLIRDVSDVISWIQGLLTEGFETPVHSLLVYYALMSLHFLVLAEELDYDVVIKVLNKKLCPIADHDAVLKLPLVVIEALVLLLGDGEFLEEEDEEESAEEERKDKGAESYVSLQVSASVDTLIAIGNAMASLAANNDNSAQAVERIRRKVFFSLSNYSNKALGIDEDLVKSSVCTDEKENETHDSRKEIRNRYTCLRQLVIAGAIDLSKQQTVDEKKDSGITNLAVKLIQLEEGSLGPLLWQKRGTQQSQKMDGSEAVAAKPPPKGSFDLETTLSTISASLQTTMDCADSPYPAKSIATLFSAPDEDLLSVFRENADSSIDTVDPLLFIFSVHGFLYLAQKIAAQNPLTIKKINEEFQSWCDSFISFDAMCLAFSCFCVYNPFDLGDNDHKGLKELHDMVLNAYKNHEFEKDHVGQFCLGLSGIFCLRVLGIEQISEIVDLLEQSAHGYGRQQTFAPYYAIAMIANACSLYLRPGSGTKVDLSDLKKLIYRTVGIILRELVKCSDDENCESILKLAINMLSGEGVVSASLIDAVLKLEPNSIPLLASKKLDAHFLFLSCAVSFPALADVNSYLLLALFRFLESFEWGSEKGIAIPSVILACQKSGVMKNVLLEQIYNAYTSDFKKLKNKNDAQGARDVYFALKATDWSGLGENQDQLRLPALNKKRLDDEGAALTLVASVMSIATFSCFGTSNFQRLFRLRDIDNDECITKVVDDIFKAVTLKDGSYNCSIGIVLMGLLSSMTDSQDDDDDDCQTILSLPQTSEEKITSAQNARNLGISGIVFTKISIPHDGTVVAGLRNRLEHCFSCEKEERDNFIKTFLASLALISVPESYAAGFLEFLLREGIDQEDALSFLSSQVSKRRRAFSSGESFIKLATQMYQTDLDHWYMQLGNSSTKLLYIQTFANLFPKLPDIAVDQCLEKLWLMCSSSDNECEMVMALLESIDTLLQSPALPRKIVNSIQRFTYGNLFELVSSLDFEVTSKRSAGKASIMQLYARCLSKVPISILDEKTFLSLNESIDCFNVETTRATLKLELIKMKYFDSNAERGPYEIATITSWLSKSILSSNDEMRNRLRSIVFSFATTLEKNQSIVKRDVLASILEVLLLAETPRCRVALEWLAVVLASWLRGLDTNGDFPLGFLCTVDFSNFETLSSDLLDQVLEIMVKDLPPNLACFSRNENLSSIVSNLLHRLLRRWSKQNTDKDTIDCVQRAAICCQSSATSEAFVSLATSILVQSILAP